MWPSDVFMDIRLKMRIGMQKKIWQKTPKQMGPWEKMFPFFFYRTFLLK